MLELLDIKDTSADIEILSLSDRIVIMFDGSLVGEKINENVTDREVGLLMAGITN